HGGGDTTASESAAGEAGADDVPPMPAEDGRVEHTLGDLPPEPVVDAAPVEPVAPEVLAVSALPHAELNEAVDCIAMLECPAPVAGARIAARAEPLFDVEVARLVHWEGYDENERAWRAVRPEQEYTLVRAGLQ